MFSGMVTCLYVEKRPSFTETMRYWYICYSKMGPLYPSSVWLILAYFFFFLKTVAFHNNKIHSIYSFLPSLFRGQRNTVHIIPLPRFILNYFMHSTFFFYFQGINLVCVDHLFKDSSCSLSWLLQCMWACMPSILGDKSEMKDNTSGQMWRTAGDRAGLESKHKLRKKKICYLRKSHDFI